MCMLSNSMDFKSGEFPSVVYRLMSVGYGNSSFAGDDPHDRNSIKDFSVISYGTSVETSSFSHKRCTRYLIS